ncbi:MAG: integration host factor subunit beta [Candidatus Latescibacteria bacterium]|nr:integration host factor subunit beta [Candidatus Latescibacterota bacterium]
MQIYLDRAPAGYYRKCKNTQKDLGGISLSTITKKELALLVSQSTGFKKNLTAQMVDSLFIAMRDNLIEGERIEIRGFGVFQVKDTRPKPAARNPRTCEVIYVPARRKSHFKPGRLLKEALHQVRPDAGQGQAGEAGDAQA